MFEIASDPQTRGAYTRAHDARGDLIRALWQRLFGRR